MRTFIMLYASDIESDDDRQPNKSGKSSSSERRAFSLLSSVCGDWHQTLIGWPQSSTPLWLRHKIKKLIERVYISPLYLPCFAQTSQNSINDQKQNTNNFYLKLGACLRLVFPKKCLGAHFFPDTVYYYVRCLSIQRRRRKLVGKRNTRQLILDCISFTVGYSMMYYVHYTESTTIINVAFLLYVVFLDD